MGCIKDNLIDKFIKDNLIKPNTREIINLSEFKIANTKYSQLAKDKFNLSREDELFSIDMLDRTKLRARTVLRAIPNEDFINELESSESNTLPKIKYFDNTNDRKAKDVVNEIAASNHPLNKVAEKLSSLNILADINVLSKEEYDFISQKVGHFNGIFFEGKNKISISPYGNNNTKGIESTIIHEVIHSLTAKKLKEDSIINKDLTALYNFALKNVKDKSLYALSSLDEFVVALFSDAKFILELTSIPASNTTKYNNLFQEVFDYILSLFNISNESSLYEEAFSVVSNILNEAPEVNQYSKALEFQRDNSQRIQNAHEKFYSKLKDVDGKYMQYLENRPSETIETTQAKIERLQEAFDVVVVVDTSLESSGVLLSSNNPISKRNGKPTIVINPNRLFADTVIHEFGHLYIDLLGGMQDSLVQDAIELLKGSDLWETVEDNYPELSQENLAKEVLATALGIEGDILFKNDLEKKSIWQNIKNTILNLLSKIFGGKYSQNSLERLASEMLNNKVRYNSTKTFNNLIEQHSKYKLENPSQEDITKLFDSLRNDFELDVDTHKYKHKETGKIYNNSVSEFAKNISKGFNTTKKGSYDLVFDDAYKLTKENFALIINKARIPYALDKTLDELFKGDLPGANTLLVDKETYWHKNYTTKKATNDFTAEMLDNMIEDNIDIINERATKLEQLKEIPLLAGNLIHDAIENYIKFDQDIPDRIVDKSGKLVKTIEEIISRGKKEGSKFFTEQMLFSEAANKPGTADLIEITKDGKFRIYDYKTMSSFTNRFGNKKSDTEMYITPGYLNQILIYSTILEEYGLKPADNFMNFISLEIDRDSLDINDPNSELYIIDIINKNIDPNDKNLNTKIAKARSKIVSRFKDPGKLSDFNIKTEEITINNLTDKIERAIRDYKKLTGDLSGKFVTSALSENKLIDKILEDIKELDSKNNKLVVLSYILNMREALTSVYAKSVDRSDDIDSEYLKNLDFLIQTSTFIPDVKEFITSQQDDFVLDDKDKEELLFLLKETEDTVTQIKDMSYNKTKELAISTLAINSNYMVGVFKEVFEMEARKLGKTSKKDIDEYINLNLKEKHTLIQQKEYEYWEDLFNNGYTDLRYLEYLLADPGMSKSQFVQVVKNIMDKVDQSVRTDLDNEVAELVNWHSNLKFNTKGNPKKVWAKFIEKSVYKDLNGNTVTEDSASVIPEFTSKYREEYLTYQNKFNYLYRELKKARVANNTKLEESIKEKIEDLKLHKSKNFSDKKFSTKLYVHPQFKKMSKEEQEALKFIHKKLEDADNRLYSAPLKKLVRELADENKIYNLPRKRQSGIESLYDTKNTWDRFTSGIKDFVRPPADEDELNIGDDNNAANTSSQEFDDFRTNNTDVLGDPLYDIPIFYRNELDDPNLQSFDIPTLLALNDETTILYENYKMIEADLFMITSALKNSTSLKTDSVISNNVVDKLRNGLTKTLRSDDNLTFKAVQASINNRFYKRSYQGIYSGLNYKFIKGAEALSKSTSAILLAGNFASASMTGIQGSIYRFVEGVAGENFSLNDVKLGSKKAWIDVNNIIKDSQKQFPVSKTALLIRRFGLETQYEALVNKFVQDNFATKNLDEGALFTVTSIAETMVTANLMYTLMSNIKVMDKDGDFIDSSGNKVKDKSKAMSIDEAYSVEDGKLKLHDKVVFTEMNLTSEFKNNIEGEKTIAATEVSRYIRSIYADLYGQYNQDMKSVAEMHIMGKLAFSMRKWIPRGYARRFRGITNINLDFDQIKYDENLSKRFYSQDQQKLQEGYYTTGARYIYSLLKTFKQKEISFSAAMKDINTKMSTHERTNLKRAAYEFAIIGLSAMGAMMLRVVALEMGDDDKDKDKIYFAAYLAERIKLESATFINPTELLENLKNPAASVNTISRIQKLLWSLFGVAYNKDLGAYDFEIDNVYEKGERKGELKLYRNIEGLIPYYKKVKQAKGILGFNSDESISDSYEYLIR